MPREHGMGHILRYRGFSKWIWFYIQNQDYTLRNKCSQESPDPSIFSPIILPSWTSCKAGKAALEIISSTALEYAKEFLQLPHVIPAQHFFRSYLDSIHEHVKMIYLSVISCWIPTICSYLFFILGCSALLEQAQWPTQTSSKSWALRTSTSGFTLQYVPMDLKEEETPQYKSSSLTCRCFWYFRESHPDTTCISLGACHLWTFHFTLKSYFFFFLAWST